MESDKAREERLRKRREADRRRREAESPEQRRARLDRLKEYRQKQKASETDVMIVSYVMIYL